MIGRRVFALLLLAAAPASAETVRVFAAASLNEAFQEIGAAFEKGHPGVDVEFNFAGSQTLRTQIEQGAPADVFASADLVHADALRQQGLIGEHRVFAHNELVVVTPPAGAGVRRLRDLARPGMKIVVAASTVPAGRYTGEVLSRMQASGLYGDGFRARVQANVVSEETNVRAVLAKVSLGEADAGFVYATDAATRAGKVKVLSIPASLNAIAIHPIAVVTRSRSGAAVAFVEHVLGEAGQAMLRRRGFKLPSQDRPAGSGRAPSSAWTPCSTS